MKKPYYITTPIYYVTDAPHIGHLYTTVAADIMARYHRLLGEDVHFLTGTDEHGQKIQKKAKETQETPQALADRVVERYRTAWKKYGITYDDFIRTTEERHKKVVQNYFHQLMKTGDIYLGDYEGWYCVPDETYWTETQLVDGKCPDCGRVVEKLREESYFFKMSAYQDALLKHIEANPNFIIPKTRRNEVVSFIEQGLKDISVSRTTIDWGIPIQPDGKATKQHKVYVWFDALTNYISALGPLDKNPLYEKFWKEAIHLVGKDILRFHAIYWPTFLLALKLPLPKQIVAHGWLTDANRKISKSTGNVIDPMQLADEVGIDGMRFFLFREFIFGTDGEYTKESLYQRINSDLANDYGNSVSRVCSMILKYFPEGLTGSKNYLDTDSLIRSATLDAIPKFHSELPGFGFNKALEAIWQIVNQLSQMIEQQAPWKLAKSTAPEDKEKLKTLLIHCHEGLRNLSLCLQPFIPTTAEKALQTLGIKNNSFDPLGWGLGEAAIQVQKPEVLFARLEMPKQC